MSQNLEIVESRFHAKLAESAKEPVAYAKLANFAKEKESKTEEF